MSGDSRSLPRLSDAEAMFAPAFELHGKTIKGSMQMGSVYGLDFTDETHMLISVVRMPGGHHTLEIKLQDGEL